MEQTNWPIRFSSVQFPNGILSPCFLWQSGSGSSLQISNCFLLTRIFKTRTPGVKNTCKFVQWLGMI